MTRKTANLKILKMLEAYVLAYPDQRFTQMLVNLDVSKNREVAEGFEVDVIHFYEESEETLKNITKAMENEKPKN